MRPSLKAAMAESNLIPYPWQHALWHGLANRLAEGRMPHALLFAGPAGLGKRHLADILAAALLCEQRNGEGLPCGTCHSCQLFAAGNHPDYLHLRPEEEKRTIGIDQIRELAAYFSLKSHYGRHKVVVLEPADVMTLASANALLKTLEEPAPGNLLVLCSDQPASLLATIRSRCQKVSFAPVAPALALPWLEQRLAQRSQAQLLFALAGGMPLKALALAEEGSLASREMVLHDIDALMARSGDAVQIAGRWHQQGAAECLRWLHQLLLDVARIAAGAGDLLRNPDQKALLERLAEGMDLVSLHQLMDKLHLALTQVKGQANPQLLLEELLVGWPGRTNR